MSKPIVTEPVDLTFLHENCLRCLQPFDFGDIIVTTRAYDWTRAGIKVHHRCASDLEVTDRPVQYQFIKRPPTWPRLVGARPSIQQEENNYFVVIALDDGRFCLPLTNVGSVLFWLPGFVYNLPPQFVLALDPIAKKNEWFDATKPGLMEKFKRAGCIMSNEIRFLNLWEPEPLENIPLHLLALLQQVC